MHGRSAGLIMQEGERGDEMFIVQKGIVQVTIAADGDPSKQRVLGKLRMNDLFGEMGAIVQESPGVPLPRMRTAFAITHDCSLLTLSFDQLIRLRSQSWAIDVAVGRAAEQIRSKRKLLFNDKKPAVREHVNIEHFAYSTMKLHNDIAQVRSEMRSEIETVHTKLDEIKALVCSSRNP